MISGTSLMLGSSVDSWISLLQVRYTVSLCCEAINNIMLCWCFSDSFPVLRSTYGNGVVPFLLDNVVCTGSESNLLQCAHTGLGEHNCDPSETAGVICEGITDLYRLWHSDGKGNCYHPPFFRVCLNYCSIQGHDVCCIMMVTLLI